MTKDRKNIVVGMFCGRGAATSSRSGVPVVRSEDPCLGDVGNVGMNDWSSSSRKSGKWADMVDYWREMVV